VLTISGGSVTNYYSSDTSTLTGVWGASAVINNGYVYLIGGCKANLNTTTALGMCNNGTTSQTNATNSIQYAPLPSGGGKINQAFSSATVNLLTAAYVASINSDGTTNEFLQLGTLPGSTNIVWGNSINTPAIYNNNLYFPYYISGTGTNIYQSSLNSISHNGIYSYLLNSLSSVTPYGLTVSGTSGKYDDTVTYLPMGDSSSLCNGQSANVMPVLSGYNSISIPPGSTCTNNTTSQYYLFTININDNTNFSFPENSNNHSTFTGLTLYYHPNSGSRLRGGIDGAASSVLNATGNLQTLDTPR
jgi:hypothetical protein